ncbi:hypothetical protein B0H14DRAFT_2630599 [Mycena olivaceomarginata]|nr:hypothetical protein B0H14DRAFT_2630599 [Mycena olivaceomarginata]
MDKNNKNQKDGDDPVLLRVATCLSRSERQIDVGKAEWRMFWFSRQAESPLSGILFLLYRPAWVHLVFSPQKLLVAGNAIKSNRSRLNFTFITPLPDGPPDDVLSAALHDYSRRSLPLAQRLDYLLKDFWVAEDATSVAVPTVKKLPPDYIAMTLIAEVVTNNVSSQNGPQTIQTQISLQDGAKIPWDTVHRIMADLDPDGAEARFPGRRRQPKQRGHLADTGVYYELNFKALWMGPIGIEIYGSRCHSSSKMIKFLAVPNARCSSTVGHYYLDLVEEHGIFVQATVDGGSEIMQPMLRSGTSFEDTPPFVALKSTDNIPIESSWHLFTNYIGLDIKQILLLGKSNNYFMPGSQLHIFGLTHFGVPVSTDLVEPLRENIPKTREECYRWVSDKFDMKALEIYNHIGAPKFILTDGWTIYCQMLPYFD